MNVNKIGYQPSTVRPSFQAYFRNSDYNNDAFCKLIRDGFVYDERKVEELKYSLNELKKVHPKHELTFEPVYDGTYRITNARTEHRVNTTAEDIVSTIDKLIKQEDYEYKSFWVRPDVSLLQYASEKEPI